MTNFTPDFLRTVVDALLPGLPATTNADALPSASQIGVDQKLAHHLSEHRDASLLNRALETIIEQAGGTTNFLTTTEDDLTAILQTVEVEEEDAFQTLLFIVSADYYENETVLRAFGWRATPPQPLGYSLPPFDEDLLAPVKQRQQLWRSTEGNSHSSTKSNQRGNNNES